MLLKMSISFVEILYSAHRIGLSKYSIHGAHAAERGKKGTVSLFFINVLSHFCRNVVFGMSTSLIFGSMIQRLSYGKVFTRHMTVMDFLKKIPQFF